MSRWWHDKGVEVMALSPKGPDYLHGTQQKNEGARPLGDGTPLSSARNCTRCKQRKSMRGGSNKGFRFVCKDCR